MFEIILMFLIIAALWYFLPGKGSARSFSKSSMSESGMSAAIANVKPSVAAENFSFLSHLQREVEAELFPRPTCSVLQRHYDTLVAVEVESRLALMAE